MSLPEGYEEINKVCRLQKALYGLKQAPLRWNEHFSNFLCKKGLTALKVEQCIFKNERGTIYLAIYVDDGLVIGKNEDEINELMDGLKQKFEMVIYDDVTTFLGIEVKRNGDMIKLSQENYTDTVLKRFQMDQAKPAITPMNTNNVESLITLTRTEFPYREAIGSILYLTNKTRPDIAYSVGYGSRKLETPSNMDINNVKRIMRYLVSTKSNGIVYNKRSENQHYEMIGYCDSDFAGDTETRKSTTGYVIYFCGGPISWCSRKQPVVALSSTEAEYIAAADCVKELLFLKTLLEELVGETVKIKLMMDNQSAMTLIKNGQFNRRSKHIDVRFHFINEKVKEGLIKIEYLATEEMIADILTKPLNNIKFLKHKTSLVK